VTRCFVKNEDEHVAIDEILEIIQQDNPSKAKKLTRKHVISAMKAKGITCLKDMVVRKHKMGCIEGYAIKAKDDVEIVDALFWPKMAVFAVSKRKTGASALLSWGGCETPRQCLCPCII